MATATGDLLSMLLLARYDDGTPMADRQVRDELVTLCPTRRGCGCDRSPERHLT